MGSRDHYTSWSGLYLLLLVSLIHDSSVALASNQSATSGKAGGLICEPLKAVVKP
jgi:hypothetical protein